MKAACTFVLASLLVLPACTGVEPAMIGVGVTAVQQGVTYVSGVDSYSYQPARYENVVIAAERAGSSLGLSVYARREISPTQLEIRYAFDGDDRLTVTIEHQTDLVTLVQINVKKSSRRGMATLYMRGLTYELREADGYNDEWQENLDLIG